MEAAVEHYQTLRAHKRDQFEKEDQPDFSINNPNLNTQDGQPDLSSIAYYTGPAAFHVSETQRKCLVEIDASARPKFMDCLATIHWPEASVTTHQFRSLLSLLLKLEADSFSFTKENTPFSNIDQRLEKRASLPFEYMAQVYWTRLKYHFQGKRPTNQLDKPELYLDYLLNILKQQVSFMKQLDTLVNGNAMGLFVDALMVWLRKKLVKDQLKMDFDIRSHTVYQLYKFQAELKVLYDVDCDIVDLLADDEWLKQQRDYFCGLLPSILSNETLVFNTPEYRLQFKQCLDTLTERLGYMTLEHQIKYVQQVISPFVQAYMLHDPEWTSMEFQLERVYIVLQAHHVQVFPDWPIPAHLQ